MKYAMQERQLVRVIQKLGLDIPQVLGLRKKKERDIWAAVRGILPKKPTGLQYQRAMRKEWL